MKNDLESHEKECLYRLVRCVDLACHDKVPFVNLLDHMSNDHEREDFVNAEGSSYKSHFIVHDEDFSREIMWISDHLMLDGRHFFRECCRNADGLWFIWVYLLGSRKEAENYHYNIKIYSEDKVCICQIDHLMQYVLRSFTFRLDLFCWVLSKQFNSSNWREILDLHCFAWKSKNFHEFFHLPWYLGIFAKLLNVLCVWNLL